ncbi:LysR family transcriptional regulator [Paenibacillus thalictri]|uniref:LysR family transcriptional regulator n=1 Tax=Paenibacillus thalictri TaxID=2527873 RepID=A0A4Q9DK51_9BACL|nr:LysR family transcriptional regulator [Paenibacillus thalictri]TBL71089.1 LysR family transcriptional regulator [Paenibacillus thalictri]
MINLEWYRIFWHTAKAGNLTKAAQELYITQPSVSYAIKQLEESFGLKLFHRLSKGVELTEEGKALLDYVESSLALLQSAESKLLALKRLEAGELRVGASDSLFKHLLLPYLDDFRACYPNVRICLSHGKTADIARRLKDGQIDCGIVHLPLSDAQLDVRPLRTIEDVFVAGASYRDRASCELTAEELAALPLLMLSAGSSTRQYVEMWFAAQGISASADIELGSVDLLVELALRGFGVAFVTRSFVRQELEAGLLVELRPVKPLPPRTIGIAVRRDVSLPLPVERFIAMLSGGNDK